MSKNTFPILDSSLISPTFVLDTPKKYTIKLVDCGSYQQIYYYESFNDNQN